MVYDIAHHPDKHQVDGIAQGLAYRHNFGVVLVFEIGKRVHTATRKKALPRAGGIASLEGGIQEGGEVRWWSDLQALDDPE